MKSPITTHVLDTSLGRPAEGVPVVLARLTADSWAELSRRETDAEGRVRDLLPAAPLQNGVYRLIFDTGMYFKKQKVETFYPEVVVIFSVADERHHHVPLLLNPYGYSTYRGS